MTIRKLDWQQKNISGTLVGVHIEFSPDNIKGKERPSLVQVES